MAESMAENYWLFLYTNTKGLNSWLAIRLSIDYRYGLARPQSATGGHIEPMTYSRIESQKTNLPTTCTATITKALLKLIIKLLNGEVGKIDCFGKARKLLSPCSVCIIDSEFFPSWEISLSQLSICDNPVTKFDFTNHRNFWKNVSFERRNSFRWSSLFYL